METRLGQAAPLVVAMEAILAACPLVADMEVVAEGPCVGLWLLVMPRWSLSLQASPGGLLVPVRCPVLSVWPWRAFLSCLVLYCLVCLAPEGSWYPLTSPGKFFGGGVVRVPAVGAGPRGPRPRPPKTICHGLQSSQLRHGLQSSQLRYGLQSSQLHHGLLSSLHRHGFQSSQLRHGPCLSVPLWRSPSCVLVRICHEGPPERRAPPPDGTVKARDEPLGRGELCQGSVVCVMCSRLLCPYMVCFLSLFHVIMS